MYLINYPQVHAFQNQFIAADRYRVSQVLAGVVDGANLTFTTPDKFTHNLPFFTIAVYYNGVRLTLLDDYTLAESGGPGTGYDTVILEFAPLPKDRIFADYVTLL